MFFLKQSVKISLPRQSSLRPTFIPLRIEVSPKSKRGFIPYESNMFDLFKFKKHSGRGTRNFRTGFTLVETLVAISILLTAVVAPMVLISGTIGSIFGTKDKITALYLAEDAVDFVKYKIATNFNTPQFWLTGIAPPCSGGQVCMVDSFNNTIQTCGGACPLINFDSSRGVYEYTLGSPSKFTREVTIVAINPANDPYPSLAPQEAVITARVSWQYKGSTKKVEIIENVFPWAS